MIKRRAFDTPMLVLLVVHALVFAFMLGVAVFATIEHVNGNPTAINAIVGAGLGTVGFGGMTVFVWRSGRTGD